MCGIAGYFQTDGTPALPRHLRAMADAMIKRGPDGEGVFTDGPLGLAHRRLSIIDLEGGAQPMTTADGSLTVVFNGEIFNYRELRAELEKAGKFTFRTKSDTEVIPALYRAEGEDFVRRLNGFFAFALYDREKRKLLLARDRFGVKPLFYFQDGTRFAFASTLNALKTLPGFDRSDLSMESIAEFLAFQYIPGNATVYRNVFRLDPGSLMTLQLDDGSIRTRPFVSHGDRKTTSLSYEEARQHLRELVTDAVERRLNADVPLGVFLSGGLDSAIVCGTAATLMKEPLECFSIGFADPAYDESALARQSADFIQSYAKVPVRLHTKEADPCDFRLLSEMAREFGEPYADASLLPESLLCRFTRETVTTVVSGDGADELFGGYDRYRAMNFFHRAPLPRPLCRALASLLPSGGERTIRGRLKRFLTAASLPPGERYRFIMTHGAAPLLERSSMPCLLEGVRRPHAWDELAPDGNRSPWETDVRTYLPGDVLCKVDVCSMAASLEVRSPFLDFRVADFAASMPFSWKIRGGRRKRILADAFADLIPPDLIRRKKRGFGVPVASWFRGEWNTPLREHLFSGVLDDLIRKETSAELLRAHETGEQDLSYWLFSLLMLELFLENDRA